MSEAIGSHAMILAAGFGVRMRPLTNDRPKPLIEVAGKPLIDYGMERLREAGVQKAVVNGHYRAAQILLWSQQQTAPEVAFSDEQAEILDTGGGIAKALPLLGRQPFFVLNSDSFWIDGRVPALSRLRAVWDDATMDCLLLLCHVDRTVGYDGRGDFRLERDGRITRHQGPGALAYIGGYLVHPRLFAGTVVKNFSMNVLWDKAISEGRLHGIAHSGKWFHVGTPAAVGLAEAELAKT
jgi:MurNAc alpha-1-phosphate uridylyltransferase